MINSTTITATTIPIASPAPDFDDDPVAPPVPVAAAVADAPAEADPEPPPPANSGFDVSLGAEACNAFNGSTIPYPYWSLCCPAACPEAGSAVAIRSRITCPTVQDGCAARTNATVADT